MLNKEEDDYDDDDDEGGSGSVVAVSGFKTGMDFILLYVLTTNIY